MTGLGPHWVFIVAAYLGVAVVTGLTIWSVVASARRIEARIMTLETETRPHVVASGRPN